jgi:chorismate dehydratase
MTGLPFVFAVWTARAQADLDAIPEKLQQAKQLGMRHISEIIQRHALPRGWPEKLAHQYLTENLKFDISDPQLRAIEKFHALAAQHALIPGSPAPLRIFE